MKLATALAGLCLVVVMVTANPSKRFLHHSHHHIGHVIHHIGHEIDHGLHHVGHEIDHGIEHLGHEFSHITGIHNPRDLACKIYPVAKKLGQSKCATECVTAAAANGAAAVVPFCGSACKMVFHEADKLTGC
ncbi:uncharacterized protein LOC143298952 isoform X2 [Babylonia areolata]|uniref:uncharacterized protein LOC143298952 isoform X2 n=1 Tax=Babylonia areolata TaxID=304850 RepID=UPI003FD4E765